MPEIKYYEVQQTRRVKVMANDPESAVLIAACAFEYGQKIGNTVKNPGMAPFNLEEVWGNTISPIEVSEIKVTQE